MGLLGRYIDRLPERARDRIIEATAWQTGSGLDYANGPRCLVGHAEDWVFVRGVFTILDRVAEGNRWVASDGWIDREVPIKFDKVVMRFGMDRVVRACKARAAKGTGPGLVTLQTADATA